MFFRRMEGHMKNLKDITSMNKIKIKNTGEYQSESMIELSQRFLLNYINLKKRISRAKQKGDSKIKLKVIYELEI